MEVDEELEEIYRKYPDLDNFILATLDLDLEEGVVIPLLEDGGENYIIRMRHLTEKKMIVSSEIPKDVIDDFRVWEHEFVEHCIEWLFHSKFHEDSGSTWQKSEKKFPFLGYELDTGDHPASHVLTALNTVSGYNDEKGVFKLLEPEEYVKLITFKNTETQTKKQPGGCARAEDRLPAA